MAIETALSGAVAPPFPALQKAISVNVWRRAGREGLGRGGGAPVVCVYGELEVHKLALESEGHKAIVIWGDGGHHHGDARRTSSLIRPLFNVERDCPRIGRTHLASPIKNHPRSEINYLRRHTFRVTATNDLLGIPRHQESQIDSPDAEYPLGASRNTHARTPSTNTAPNIPTRLVAPKS